METLRLILLYAHLIGFAVLFGGGVVQYFSGVTKVNTAMATGSIIQLVTGLALSAPLDRGTPDGGKLAVKGVIAVLIGIMVLVPYFRKRSTSEGAVVHRGHFLAIVLLTLVNAGVAVFWR